LLVSACAEPEKEKIVINIPLDQTVRNKDVAKLRTDSKTFHYEYGVAVTMAEICGPLGVRMIWDNPVMVSAQFLKAKMEQGYTIKQVKEAGDFVMKSFSADKVLKWYFETKDVQEGDFVSFCKLAQKEASNKTGVGRFLRRR
jgi:hypothetical protein